MGYRVLGRDFLALASFQGNLPHFHLDRCHFFHYKKMHQWRLGDKEDSNFSSIPEGGDQRFEISRQRCDFTSKI
jgi:hypothetical protein